MVAGEDAGTKRTVSLVHGKEGIGGPTWDVQMIGKLIGHSEKAPVSSHTTN